MSPDTGAGKYISVEGNLCPTTISKDMASWNMLRVFLVIVAFGVAVPAHAESGITASYSVADHVGDDVLLPFGALGGVPAGLCVYKGTTREQLRVISCVLFRSVPLCGKSWS